MAQHLVQGALRALRIEREHAQHDEAEMADRGIGDQLLDVGLHHGDQRPVHDADHRQRHDQRGRGQCGVGKQRQREAQEPVRAHLEQHRGQDDRPAGRRFDVGVRQPGMERKQRHLDGEREAERGEQPALHVRGHVQRGQMQQVERRAADLRVVQRRQVQDGDQHQQAAGQRVEQEFQRRVDTPLAAPHADQKIHRDQHDFPEDVEQEQINRDEGADHPGLQNEEADQVFLDPLGHAAPGGQHHQRRQQRGQQDQEQTDAVHAYVVGHAEVGNPGVVLDELEVRARGVELQQQAERDDEGQQRGTERGAAHQGGVARVEREQDEPAQQRQQDDRAHHGATPSTRPR